MPTGGAVLVEVVPLVVPDVLGGRSALGAAWPDGECVSSEDPLDAAVTEDAASARLLRFAAGSTISFTRVSRHVSDYGAAAGPDTSYSYEKSDRRDHTGQARGSICSRQ